MVVSHPDTAYAVRILSQYIQNPGLPHWEGLKRVIMYLSNTKNLWLIFGEKKETFVEEYCNADWVSQEDWHSISGFSFHYGHGVVLWSLKKQSIIALSSMEAEYIVETHTAKEAIWLRMFVNEINGGMRGPLTLMVDNQGAIALAKDNEFYLRTIHTDLQYYFIHEAIEDGKVKILYIPSMDNTADIFTKPLAKPKFKQFVEALGLVIMKE